MNEHIPHLNINQLPNGNLRLENESMGETYIVDIHPIHVRMLAERLGFIGKSSSKSSSVPTAAELARDLHRLKCNLLRLRDHSLQLQREMRNADWAHADLTFEMMKVNGLVDLCDMAVDDFVDDFAPRPPDEPEDFEPPSVKRAPKIVADPAQAQLEIEA